MHRALIRRSISVSPGTPASSGALSARSLNGRSTGSHMRQQALPGFGRYLGKEAERTTPLQMPESSARSSSQRIPSRQSSSNGTVKALRCAIWDAQCSTDEGLSEQNTSDSSWTPNGNRPRPASPAGNRRAGSALPDATTTAASPAGTF